MKVIIAGSRDLTDYEAMLCHMGTLPPDWPNPDGKITEIVSGGAKGPDHFGEWYAELQGLPLQRFIPNWDGQGKKAGILRNIEMGEYADALIAFWNGSSRGTFHMIEFMKKLKKPIYVVNTSTHTGEVVL